MNLKFLSYDPNSQKLEFETSAAQVGEIGSVWTTLEFLEPEPGREKWQVEVKSLDGKKLTLDDTSGVWTVTNCAPDRVEDFLNDLQSGIEENNAESNLSTNQDEFDVFRNQVLQEVASVSLNPHEATTSNFDAVNQEATLLDEQREQVKLALEQAKNNLVKQYKLVELEENKGHFASPDQKDMTTEPYHTAIRWVEAILRLEMRLDTGYWIQSKQELNDELIKLNERMGFYSKIEGLPNIDAIRENIIGPLEQVAPTVHASVSTLSSTARVAAVAGIDLHRATKTSDPLLDLLRAQVKQDLLESKRDLIKNYGLVESEGIFVAPKESPKGKSFSECMVAQLLVKDINTFIQTSDQGDVRTQKDLDDDLTHLNQQMKSQTQLQGQPDVAKIKDKMQLTTMKDKIITEFSAIQEKNNSAAEEIQRAIAKVGSAKTVDMLRAIKRKGQGEVVKEINSVIDKFCPPPPPEKKSLKEKLLSVKQAVSHKFNR